MKSAVIFPKKVQIFSSHLLQPPKIPLNITPHSQTIKRKYISKLPYHSFTSTLCLIKSKVLVIVELVHASKRDVSAHSSSTLLHFVSMHSIDTSPMCNVVFQSIYFCARVLPLRKRGERDSVNLNRCKINSNFVLEIIFPSNHVRRLLRFRTCMKKALRIRNILVITRRIVKGQQEAITEDVITQ